jgi:hypothetical protein
VLGGGREEINKMRNAFEGTEQDKKIETAL